MAKLHNSIVKLYSIYVPICFIKDRNNMIQKKEFVSMKMHKVNLFLNVFKIKLADLIKLYIL